MWHYRATKRTKPDQRGRTDNHRKQVFYRLYEYHGADLWYEVEIELTGERETASLGSDFSRAADIYKALFLGEVTPCTLKNIIEDCFN